MRMLSREKEPYIRRIERALLDIADTNLNKLGVALLAGVANTLERVAEKVKSHPKQ